MLTIAHESLPVSSHTAWQSPFRTIALLACMAVAMSACKTTGVSDTGNRRPPTSHTQLEPEKAAQDLFNTMQAQIQQGKEQEAFATLNELNRRFGQDPRRSVQAIIAQALSLKARFAVSDTEKNALQVEIGCRYGGDIDPAKHRQLVTDMFNQAAALSKGNISAAIQVYKQIEQMCSDGKNKSWGAQALFNQGDLQRQMRNPKAAIAAYERLDQRFAQEADPATRAIVADALFKKGEMLAEQANPRAAIAAYEEIDRRYADDRNANIRLWAARALFAKGSLLSKQGMEEEPNVESARLAGDTAAAVAVYDDIVRRFGRDKDINIHNFVGGTLLKKSETLRLTGDDKGTIAAYDEIIGLFGNDTADISRMLVATAFFRKGLTLGKQEGSLNLAINSFDELIRRFGNDHHQPVRKIAGQAVAARQKLIDGMGAARNASEGSNKRHDDVSNTPLHDN